MKKSFFILLVLMLFLSSFVAASSAKRKAILFYAVQDSILMCQNKDEDIEKGRIEFEKQLKKSYSKRFDLIDIKPAPKGNMMLFDNITVDKRSLFAIPKDELPILITIQLLGNGVGNATYQNGYGASRAVSVPTTTIAITEYQGYRITEFEGKNILLPWEYGVRYYGVRPHTVGGDIIVPHQSDRVAVKNAVKAYLGSLAEFSPPNKYVQPKAYDMYLYHFVGAVEELYLLMKDTNQFCK